MPTNFHHAFSEIKWDPILRHKANLTPKLNIFLLLPLYIITVSKYTRKNVCLIILLYVLLNACLHQLKSGSEMIKIKTLLHIVSKTL